MTFSSRPETAQPCAGFLKSFIFGQKKMKNSHFKLTLTFNINLKLFQNECLSRRQNDVIFKTKRVDDVSLDPTCEFLVL